MRQSLLIALLALALLSSGCATSADQPAEPATEQESTVQLADDVVRSSISTAGVLFEVDSPREVVAGELWECTLRITNDSDSRLSTPDCLVSVRVDLGPEDQIGLEVGDMRLFGAVGAAFDLAPGESFEMTRTFHPQETRELEKQPHDVWGRLRMNGLYLETPPAVVTMK